MTRAYIPGQNVPISLGGAPVEPVWYDFFRFVETLQPLSDIVFPDPPAEGVTSIDGVAGDFTIGYALTRTAQELSTSFTTLTASNTSDVALNNTANYFSGPSVAQGTTGTWLVIGHAQLTSSTQDNFDVKLWDGTTVIAAASQFTFSTNITLAGIITSPAGNLRLDAKDRSSTNGFLRANVSSNGNKDTQIIAIRIG